jgi:hypothetical protein
LAGTRGRGISCIAVFGVVMGREVSGVWEDIEGVRGDVGDFSESAVLRRVNANSSSFSEMEWRRGDRRREGEGDMLDASLMSVGARVEISVSASESVPDEEASLADDAADDGRSSTSDGENECASERTLEGVVIDFPLCVPSNRCSELYTREKGYSSIHRSEENIVPTCITPLITTLVIRSWWRGWSYFSLYPTVLSCPFSICRRLKTGSSRLTNSLSSWSGE